jgi:hypothetical protein
VANAAWSSAKEGFLDGSIDWDTATQKAALVRGYTFNDAHKFVSDLTGAGGSIVASVTLTSKTVTGGAAGCANPVFSGVAAGAAIPAIVIYQSSAASGGADVATSAQRLIAYYDSATGLPVTPNGQSITAAVDTGPNRLFRI